MGRERGGGEEVTKMALPNPALNIFLLLVVLLTPSSSLAHSPASTALIPTTSLTSPTTLTTLFIMAPFLSLSSACAPIPPSRRNNDCNRVVVLRRVRPAGRSLICDDHTRHSDHRHLQRRFRKRDAGKRSLRG